MKISDPNSSRSISGLGPSEVARPVTEGRLAEPAKPGAVGDQGQLSKLSAHLAAARSDSPVRLEKLSHLTAAVTGGRYHVDAGLVSRRMVEDSMRFGAHF